MTAAPHKKSAGPARVFSIPPNVSFVDALAQGLLARAGGDPMALAAHMVLLPTRRACRALQEAFLRASGGRALLLPRLVPLGDIDAEDLSLEAEEAGAAHGAFEVPPAMPAMRRQLLLARAIQTWGRARGQAPGEDQAVRLAEELARLLDQVETEGLDLAALKDLVPAEYAYHWQQTLQFLVIVTEQWPKIQAEEACIGPAARRRRLLEMRAAAWRAQPRDYPVIAAGSTGSMPATADLLNTIARLPSGAVVLPGLDRQADVETWQAIAGDPAHPQFGMAALLARMDITREDVAEWPTTETPGAPAARTELVNLALAPASATAEWRLASERIPAPDLNAALEGVRRIDCPGLGEEAACIALLMREALETEGRRAALVTPDRGLARRVAAALGRWGIAVDDSAGTPLAGAAPGTFLRLVAEMICGGLAPLALLAALKHPLASGGQSPGAFRAKVRALEMLVLRGPRPAPDFAGLKRALRAEKDGKALLLWLTDLESRLAPFTQAIKRARDLRTLIDGHIAAAEALAATAEDEGAARLWAGEAGEALATVLAELREASGDGALALGGAAARARYPALFTTLLGGQVVRPRYGRHPRLAIWGPLEARLQHMDLVILGGLNEGTWPSEVDPGPWLSRPMRADFGLPAPERRIGLAAHDFAQAFCAPEVVLTRATRIDGTPTVPSRWLLRLDAVLETFQPKPSLARDEAAWLRWAQALDQPEAPVPSAPPAPCPPREARPRKLPVTAIETWMRDPYDLYARRILNLKALDPLDADPGAAELGILVHRALELYIRDNPMGPPADAEAALLACGRKAFEDEATPPGVCALWWPRFERIAAWLAARESAEPSVQRFAEVKGELTLDPPGGAFTLTATADRIDLVSDGTLKILDYKTGSVPSGKEVNFGFAPQLPLEAAIAAAGGFAGVPRASVAALEYWRLTGAEPTGEVKPVKDDPQTRAEAALEGLRALIERFDDPATPYLARPRPKWMGRYSDYTHLARAAEWASGEDGDDGGGA